MLHEVAQKWNKQNNNERKHCELLGRDKVESLLGISVFDL